MLSRQVNQLLKEGDKGVEKLYTLHIKYFDLVDATAERMVNGDLLDEYELSQVIDRMTGTLAKLGSVASALEALMAEMEHNEEVKGYNSYDKVKAQDVSIVKSNARDKVSKIRKWHSDFSNYATSAEKMVTSAQSRIKRLTVEKGAKRVDFTGDTSNIKQVDCNEESPDATDVPTNGEPTSTGW